MQKCGVNADFNCLQECQSNLNDFIKKGNPLEEEQTIDTTGNPTLAQEKGVWSCAENRSKPLASPPDGLQWGDDMISYLYNNIRFLKYHDARLTGDDERASIWADLNYSWRAVEEVPGVVYVLRVVVWTVPGPCGLHSHRHTGAIPWLTFP